MAHEGKEGTPFYITTTLPYVNADPHLGHALEFIRADIIARAKKLHGFDVFFNTGTDEHGQKLLEAAREEGLPVEEYVSKYSKQFRDLLPRLGISEDVHFIRTTDEKHVRAAQAFWSRVFERGYIYKKNYEAKYCVGCEENKTESELVDGRCAIHPNRELELREEENYFFKFSAFGEQLLELYESGTFSVIPDFRENEMRAFIGRGLEDFSISRLKAKMSWGIPVPEDPDHVMYVWFDALVNYISTLGWPDETETFDRYWKHGTPVQYCGKDNTRFQSVMWQAMLLAADLPPARRVVVNGFVTGEGGIKMSKSLGNGIDPRMLVERYGTDALRYFVARELSSFEDTPFTLSRFAEAYQANLANGLGNLVSRIMKLAEGNLEGYVPEEHVSHGTIEAFLSEFEIQKAMNHIWEEIGKLDVLIQEKKPWESKDTEVIRHLVSKLEHIGNSLAPFMPETSEKIITAIHANAMPKESLFPRKD